MQSATSSLLLRAWMPQNNRGEAPGRAVLTTLLWTVLGPLEQPQHPGHPASPRAAVRLVLWVFQMPFPKSPVMHRELEITWVITPKDSPQLSEARGSLCPAEQLAFM